MTPTPAPSSPDVRPTARQALATFGGGVLLAVTTCAGFWASFDLEDESAFSVAMLVVFGLSLLVVAVGMVLVLLRQARLIAAGRRAQAAGDTATTPPTSGAWQALVIAVGLGILALGAFGGLTVARGEASGIALLLTAGLAALGSVVFILIAIVRLLAGR